MIVVPPGECSRMIDFWFYHFFLPWLENFYNHSVTVGDVNNLKYFTIISPTQVLQPAGFCWLAAWSCRTLCDPHELQHARLPCSSPSASLLTLLSVQSMMPSNHLILCHSLLLPPSVLSGSESVLSIWWPNYWSFSFSIVLPINIQDQFPKFRIDWLGLLAVQGNQLVIILIIWAH